MGWLKANEFKPADSSYASYRASWLLAFKQKENEIKSACSSLHSVKAYSHAHAVADEKIQELVSKKWFRERVFDKYLWFHGNGR